MYKNILICWLFERINLSPKQIRTALDKIEEKEDWMKIIEGGDLENFPASVAEVARQDFIITVDNFVNG